jgi:hypothetical protein
MSDAGAEKMAAAIRTHRSLNHISLLKSKIGDIGAIQLLDAIEVKQSVEYLNLNKKISDYGRQRIEEI